MSQLSAAGKTWLLAIVVVVVVGVALVGLPLAYQQTHSTSQSTPTPTVSGCPDEDVMPTSNTIWLVKPDGHGHYLVVSTDSLCVARDEMNLGFYPVPEDYARELVGK